MHVLDLETLRAAPAAAAPYPHFSVGGAIRPEAIPALLTDFPPISQPGFFPIDDVPVSGTFAALLQDLQDPAFSAVVGEKLGMDLVSRPTLITVRKWSRLSDGRIHTDSQSKIATLLVYLNADWAEAAEGKLRVLRNNHDFNDYVAEINPVAGTIFGFRRTEESWHGHLPFAGERRVVQITWLLDDSKVAHKRRLGKLSRWLKNLRAKFRG